MKIYLAGGFHSGWQDEVESACPQHEYYNPGLLSLGNVRLEMDKIGAWDLHHVKRCDLVFAYMERTNPSGIGLAVEVGYAHGIGKTVILVLEPGHETIKDRYLDFLKSVAYITLQTLEDGIDFLEVFKS